MEELLSWINYCRQHPDGYYVCGCDYGYGDDHTKKPNPLMQIKF